MLRTISKSLFSAPFQPQVRLRRSLAYRLFQEKINEKKEPFCQSWVTTPQIEIIDPKHPLHPSSQKIPVFQSCKEGENRPKEGEKQEIKEDKKDPQK